MLKLALSNGYINSRYCQLKFLPFLNFKTLIPFFRKTDCDFLLFEIVEKLFHLGAGVIRELMLLFFIETSQFDL